jgi:hypothetical protein
MKPGDLVREIGMSDVGVIIGHAPNSATWGVYWRVLFGGELNYIRENDLEVISEGG